MRKFQTNVLPHNESACLLPYTLRNSRRSTIWLADTADQKATEDNAERVLNSEHRI